MDKNVTLAREIIEQVGGKENIESVLHCMTRLRFRLKDYGNIDLEQIKSINGVLGTQKAEDSLHVIIGPAVNVLYPAVMSELEMKEEKGLDENLDIHQRTEKKPMTAKTIGLGILNTFSNIMTPLIPLFVAMGMVNVIASLIGPSFFKLVTEESNIYTNFYFIYEAILYFMPVLIAASAAKIFKCNEMLAIAAVSILLFPDLIAELTSEAGYTVFGIPASNVTYSGTVIPAILIVYVLSYVERICKKIVPNALKVIGVPVLTLIAMLPLSFCLLGPLGNYIGVGLTRVVIGLYAIAGPVETMLVGAAIAFLTALGIGRPIFFACMSVLFAEGVEFAYMPISMILINYVIMGICLGYIVKSKGSENKEFGISCLLACLLGGVSEPALFGIVLPNKKSYLPTVLAGAIGGLLYGIFKVGYYQFGPSNIMAVVGLISAEGTGNLITGTVISILAAVFAFIFMLLFYKENETH